MGSRLTSLIADMLGDKNRIKSLTQMTRWFAVTWKQHYVQATMNTLIGVFLVVLDLTFVWCTKLAVDVATKVETRYTLTFVLSILVSIIVLQLLLGIASRWIKAMLGVKAQNNMRLLIFSRLLHTQWIDIRKYHSGDLINRIERDVRDVIAFLTENLPAFITTCIQFLGAFLFLFYMDKLLACIIVFILPFFILGSRFYIKKMRRLTHDIRDNESEIQSVVQESLQHTLVLKALEQVGNACGKLQKLQNRLHTNVLRKTKYSTVSSGLMNSGFAIGYLFTFGWGVMSLEQGLITYGTLIAFVQLVGQIQAPVRSLTRFIPVFISASTAGERLMELEEMMQEEIVEENAQLPSAGIKITNVSFSYSKESRTILENFSFDFPPGSITAIVGQTGAGKTTLIRLLFSLVNPQKGNLMLYNNDVSLSIGSNTRTNFSYVPQGNTLFSGTIRENLTMGAPATDDEMIEALKTAAADFILNNPLGLDCVCGEVGDGLSEGQAQRIAIARALLKKTPVYIFDEATSSLDEETERVVVKNIIEKMKGHTLIFVTHRPEILNYCTQILKLDKHL